MVFRLFILACALFAAPAFAQDYPTKPINIIVPLSAGGSTDLLARVLAVKLREKFGQPVVVENRSGAAGNIGADAVFMSVTRRPHVVVHPARSSNPGKLNFGSSGAGSAPHLAAELFNAMADVKMVHVPYKGSAESQTATLAGTVDLTFFAFSSALRHVKAGKLRALGVGGVRRNPQLPDVPSISEAVPGYSATSWTALVAPPGTPPLVASKLARAVSEIGRLPDVQKRLVEAGDESLDVTLAPMGAFLREESQRWGTLIRGVGITAQ
jgi:tripartite-type tricarboxylate transporter receptor subunit TctC